MWRSQRISTCPMTLSAHNCSLFIYMSLKVSMEAASPCERQLLHFPIHLRYHLYTDDLSSLFPVPLTP